MIYIILSIAVGFGCCLGLSKDSMKAACIFALYALIVSEAKELGIQTETPDEIAKMKSLWQQE